MCTCSNRLGIVTNAAACVDITFVDSADSDGLSSTISNVGTYIKIEFSDNKLRSKKKLSKLC